MDNVDNFNEYAELQHSSFEQRLEIFADKNKTMILDEMDENGFPSASQIVDGMFSGDCSLRIDQQIILGEEILQELYTYKDDALLKFKIERVVNFIDKNMNFEMKIFLFSRLKAEGFDISVEQYEKYLK
jgi:hypothetical protein